MMSGEAWLYLLAVLINAVNLFLQVFFTIMYSDLEWYVALKTMISRSGELPQLLYLCRLKRLSTPDKVVMC